MELESGVSSRHIAAETSLSSSIIAEGWAIIYLEQKPVLLLGKGDYVDPVLTTSPFRIVALRGSKIEHQSDAGSGSSLLRSLLRHATRLTDPALKRTADLFLEMAGKAHSDTGYGHLIEIPLSQVELAALLGMSTVHMNRTLQQLKKANLISYGKGYFSILDHQGLSEVGCR